MRATVLVSMLSLAACGPDGVTYNTGRPPRPGSDGGSAGGTGGSGGDNGTGGASTGGSASTGGGGQAVLPPDEGGGCSSDADCRPNEHCSGGELAQCIPDPVVDAGNLLPPILIGDGGVTTPIDISCDAQTNPATVYPAKWPVLPQTVPSSCRTGFEMNEPYEFLANKLYTIHSKTAAGSQALTLELDFATYLAPDGLKITGTLANGATYVLFETCRMQTADYGDPTDQQSRPPEDSIRDFRIDLKADTVQLDFDYGRSSTPTYTKITGLCDFNVPAPVNTMTMLHWWRSF